MPTSAQIHANAAAFLVAAKDGGCTVAVEGLPKGGQQIIVTRKFKAGSDPVAMARAEDNLDVAKKVAGKAMRKKGTGLLPDDGLGLKQARDNGEVHCVVPVPHKAFAEAVLTLLISGNPTPRPAPRPGTRTDTPVTPPKAKGLGTFGGVQLVNPFAS